MVDSIGTVLSASSKQQVLAARQTQRSIDSVQETLATGKSVNTALDNPRNFFTALALDNRAGDLSRLLDGVGQSISTLRQTDASIRAIQKLIDQADALLQKAEIELQPFADSNENFRIQPDDVSDFSGYAGAQDAGGTVSLSNDNTDIRFVGNTWKRLDFDYTITPNTVLRFDYQSTDTPDISAIGFDNDQSFSNNNNFFFLNGSQTNGIAYSAPIGTFRYDESGDTVSVEIPVGDYFTGDFQYLVFVNDDDINPQTGNALFRNVTFAEGEVGEDIPDEQLRLYEKFESDYGQIMSQIDQLVNDSTYRGTNLLNGDTLKTDFNEDRDSFIETEGIVATSTALGLGTRRVRSVEALEAAFAEVREARESLRDYNRTIATDISIIQTRGTLTEDYINGLEGGADKLVVADLNDASARALALSTRQQLQASILSLDQPSITNFLLES
jgi:flagellin